MAEVTLTKEMILDAAEQTLRRFGLDKATVVDVARALKVSHGTVYRHYPSKASLREAVADRWLHQVYTSLMVIPDQSGDAQDRLRLWFDQLIGLKRGKAMEDPELFAMYAALAEEAVEVVNAHIRALIEQLERIIKDGIGTGQFIPNDASATASAIFMATVRFHHPVHAKEWASPTIDQDFDQVWNLILSGIVNQKR